MKNKIEIIADIQDRPDLVLLVDSQDTDWLNSYLENELNGHKYDGFFVKENEGHYSEVYGFFGIVPFLFKPLYTIRNLSA